VLAPALPDKLALLARGFIIAKRAIEETMINKIPPIIIHH